MLDDLYNTVVVLITAHYVKDPTILLGASASKALFAVMRKKRWYEVRLLGVTYMFCNPEDKACGVFEQAAALKLLAVEACYEEVVE